MERAVESKIIFLIIDFQKRMTYLEKKIDILIKQSSERSPNGKKSSLGSGGSQLYSSTQESCFGAKITRSEPGPSDENKRWNEGRVFPKKNQTFKPFNNKRLDKSK